MVFVIESIILCGIFAGMIIPPTRKNPFSQLYNYPPKIIDRVKSLPQYEGKIPDNHVKVGKKLFGVVLFITLLTAISYLSGAKNFWHGFGYSFGLWLVVNLFDTFIMDILLFARDKVYRLPGTEDMIQEYEDPWFYIQGGLKGTVIGFVVALCVGEIISLL